MTVLVFPQPDDPDGSNQRRSGGEIVPAEHKPGVVGRHLARAVATLPSVGRLGQVARWWATTGLAGLGVLILKLPYLMLREVRPIAVGVGRVAAGWARWTAVVDYKEMSKEADGNVKAKAGAEIEARKSGRRRLSLLVVVALIGLGWWAAVAYPAVLLLAGILLIGVFDAVGRVGREKTTALPPPVRTVLREGVPLSQITGALLETFAREGLEIGIDSPMRYDAARREYRLTLSCRDEITPEHQRALERGIGAANHSIRALTTEVATNREIVIREGDPLAEVVPAPWIETGSVSIADPLDLGVSMTEVPFALNFAGEHIRGVGSTGSGKSSWFLRNAIDRVSACRDAAILGFDLSNGPELALWRGVIQKKATTVAEAKTLLAEIIAEIQRRSAILTRFAEDDDPANDHIIEWNAQLATEEGPAWVIFADEYALLAQSSDEILGRCQQIVRTGRKVWISLVPMAQKTGNTDFGSTVMTTQCNTTIALACSPKDAVDLFGKEKRDAGWCPHLLQPGTKGQRNDAGKCYLESPRHRAPDIYSCYAPLSAGEVKARARRRLADGIPPMYISGAADVVLDAAEVPELLAAVERVFAEVGNPEWMATSDLLPLVRAAGFPELTESQLSEGLNVDRAGSRRRRPGERNPVAGYTLASIRDALRDL